MNVESRESLQKDVNIRGNDVGQASYEFEGTKHESYGGGGRSVGGVKTISKNIKVEG